MKVCFLLLLVLGAALPGAASDHAEVDDPLLSPAVVLCLRPLRLAQQPGLPEALETVKRLTAFAQSQTGNAKKAVNALTFIVKDLFQKENELVSAKNGLALAERQAAAKEQQAMHEQLVGSPLSGPNPRLAAILRKEAAEIRGNATRWRDEALSTMKAKAIDYNVSVNYFLTQGDTEVVIALASSLFAVIDRHLPGFEFKPTVSREWIEEQKKPEQEKSEPVGKRFKPMPSLQDRIKA